MKHTMKENTIGKFNYDSITTIRHRFWLYVNNLYTVYCEPHCHSIQTIPLDTNIATAMTHPLNTRLHSRKAHVSPH